MSYVIQHPRSLTNPSDSYRVVEFREWADMADGVARYIPVHAEVASYDEAQRICDELNELIPEGQS